MIIKITEDFYLNTERIDLCLYKNEGLELVVSGKYVSVTEHKKEIEIWDQASSNYISIKVPDAKELYKKIQKILESQTGSQ